MDRTWAPGAAPQYGWKEGMLSLKQAALASEASPQALADELNAQTVSVAVSVPSSAALSILLKTGDWGKIKLYSRYSPGAANDQMVAIAITAVDAIEHTSALGTEREEDAQVISGMMAALVQAGLMQQTTADRLTVLMTQAEPVWFPPVTAEDVTVARTLTDG